jgi:hypothetical protein
MLFFVCLLIAIGSFWISINDAIEDYRKPVKFTTNRFWVSFWKVFFALGKFLWVLFLGFFFISTLVVIFGGSNKKMKGRN